MLNCGQAGRHNVHRQFVFSVDKRSVSAPLLRIVRRIDVSLRLVAFLIVIIDRLCCLRLRLLGYLVGRLLKGKLGGVSIFGLVEVGNLLGLLKRGQRMQRLNFADCL